MTSFEKTIPGKPAYNSCGFIISTPREIKFQFHDGQFYRLNVDGEIFLTKLKLPVSGERTQNKFIFDKIAAYQDGPEVDFLINSDPEIFRYILDYCRSGFLSLPKEFNAYNVLLEEANNFDMSRLVLDVEDLISIKNETNRFKII